MKIYDYRGHELHLPTSGGKAGKGCNRTTSLQVRAEGGNSILKQFRFDLTKPGARSAACFRARQWIDTQLFKL